MSNLHTVDPEKWDEIRDCLVLALDEIDTGPRDRQSARNVMLHLRPAMKATLSAQGGAS